MEYQWEGLWSQSLGFLAKLRWPWVYLCDLEGNIFTLRDIKNTKLFGST